MTDLKSEIIIQLTTPLQYSVNGQFEDSHELILKAPSANRRRQCNELRQGFMKGMMGMSNNSSDVKKADEDKKEELKPGDIVTVLMMSDVDFGKYVETFREVLTSGACEVVEGVKLTNPLFDKLSLQDQDTLLGEYLSNFLLASQLAKMNEK